VEITLGLAGDTMLGRMVAQRLAGAQPSTLFSAEVVAVAREADLLVLNLECCISERGTPPQPAKPFLFRAPPVAVDALTLLGTTCVTLANNHALDFGEVALLDTLEHLETAGIAAVGAGSDVDRARTPAVLEARGFRLGVVGLSDHPAEFGAGSDRPGIAFADARWDLPAWVGQAIDSIQADAVLVTPHWGPNMATSPVRHVRAAARCLLEAGATLIAGHSAHVFHGVDGPILYDLGDFVDDYAVDPLRRNDLGLFWLVTLDRLGPIRMEAVPLRLDFCHTRVASAEDRHWIRRRFVAACAEFGTEVGERDDRLIIEWR
jgi:poly-gamma-glutamate capsule biosynthesis protein CapA/YwtB (metallophosphatase superfamily)